MKGNYNEVLSLPKNLLQITPKANIDLNRPTRPLSESAASLANEAKGWDVDRQSSEPVSDGSNMALMLICSISWPAPCARYPAETLFGMCSCGSSRASTQMPTPPGPNWPSLQLAKQQKRVCGHRRGKYSLLKSPPSCTLANPNPSHLCQTLKKCCGHVWNTTAGANIKANVLS